MEVWVRLAIKEAALARGSQGLGCVIVNLATSFWGAVIPSAPAKTKRKSPPLARLKVGEHSVVGATLYSTRAPFVPRPHTRLLTIYRRTRYRANRDRNA